MLHLIIYDKFSYLDDNYINYVQSSERLPSSGLTLRSPTGWRGGSGCHCYFSQILIVACLVFTIWTTNFLCFQKPFIAKDGHLTQIQYHERKGKRNITRAQTRAVQLLRAHLNATMTHYFGGC